MMNELDDIFLTKFLSKINSHWDFIGGQEQSLGIIFALKFSQLIDKIQEYKKLLEEDESQEKHQIQHKVDVIQRQLDCLGALLKLVPSSKIESKLDYSDEKNLLQIPYPQRWKMYIGWISKLVDDLDEEVALFEEDYRVQFEKFQDVQALESSEICLGVDIIGVTTTGAAKQRALLGHLNPKISKNLMKRLKSNNDWSRNEGM